MATKHPPLTLEHEALRAWMVQLEVWTPDGPRTMRVPASEVVACHRCGARTDRSLDINGPVCRRCWWEAFGELRYQPGPFGDTLSSGGGI